MRSMTVLKFIMPITIILLNIILPILDLAIFKLKAHTMSVHICLKNQKQKEYFLKQLFSSGSFYDNI